VNSKGLEFYSRLFCVRRFHGRKIGKFGNSKSGCPGGENGKFWKILVGEPSRANTIPIWIGIKSISHSRAKALLLLSKHKHMQKFIQNTMNLSWALFGILTLLIVCGHDGPMDLKNLDSGTQIVLGAWVVLLEIAVIFTCIRMFMVVRGRWRHS
jgi:hypothetical protein